MVGFTTEIYKDARSYKRKKRGNLFMNTVFIWFWCLSTTFTLFHLK